MMTSQRAPLCRLCGKPIPKAVRAVWFGQQRESRAASWITYLTETPASKTEAARFDNGQIVSIRWSRDRSYIARMTVWNGEYVSPYFCKDVCAREFGYFAMEHPGAQTAAYVDALIARGPADVG